MFTKVLPCITLLGLPAAFAYPTVWSAVKVVSNTVALSWYSSHFDQGAPAPPMDTTASFYNCKGPHISDFPTFTEWISFNDMWKINEPVITLSNPDYPNLVPKIKEKIELVSASTQVDARLILAVIMEESTGKLTVPCTQGGMLNCGIMQAPKGSVSFNPADPENSIEQMIRDGVQGTADAPGLMGFLNGISWIQHGEFGNPYLAAHIYNGGAATGGDNLAVVENSNKKSKVYATDISSRVTGWNGGYEGCIASTQCPGQLREASDCSH